MRSPFINGALGRGCDYLITDDPHRIAENMETTINYVRQGLCTRLNTPATGRILLLMQSLAPDDLSGVLPGRVRQTAAATRYSADCEKHFAEMQSGPLINHLFPPSKRMEKPMGVGQNDDQSIMTGINFPTLGCWEITGRDENKELNERDQLEYREPSC